MFFYFQTELKNKNKENENAGCLYDTKNTAEIHIEKQSKINNKY